MVRYQDAVAAEPSAPQPQFAPFHALVLHHGDGSYSSIIVDSQGVPLAESELRYFCKDLAQIDADSQRCRMLVARAMNEWDAEAAAFWQVWVKCT